MPPDAPRGCVHTQHQLHFSFWIFCGTILATLHIPDASRRYPLLPDVTRSGPPTNVTELHSFVYIENYYGKFCHLSTTQPLVKPAPQEQGVDVDRQAEGLSICQGPTPDGLHTSL